MSGLVSQLCSEKDLGKKMALVEELKKMLDEEAQLLKAQQAKVSAKRSG